MKIVIRFAALLFMLATAMIGYTINERLDSSCPGFWTPGFWATIDFFFAPFVWFKWLVLHQVNWSIIKHSFLFLAS